MPAPEPKHVTALTKPPAHTHTPTHPHTFLDVLHRHTGAAAVAFEESETRRRLFDEVRVEVLAHLALPKKKKERCR